MPDGMNIVNEFGTLSFTLISIYLSKYEVKQK